MNLMDMSITSLQEQYMEMRDDLKELVLELLNHAVWAPNHRNREPWRFIYITGGEKPDFLNQKAPAHLVITMRNDSNTLKQNEDLAAVFCLIQNLTLLAWDKQLGVRVSFYEWMFDRNYCRKLGVPDKERIVAVLDLGFYSVIPEAPFKPSAALKWSFL
ncbi:putative NAD(P)H nitroreductase YfhC [Pullulanibacillus camelliae]|uniref:Putative NAD(P)H nitroreductase YfhC n=1 Tax=Pullulanibacillus camelliae TaxID=1707096 RepID=A0A8J2VP88_9BACL|nr:hypothetical protein [Pullulanibacillus camelliae]GGE35749.1 putative NAD(P)H nitroreductase YfhC [Pullulanibacillus camelliae]